jgi:hypothetical protein
LWVINSPERQVLFDKRDTVQHTTRETAHRGNRAVAWGGDEDEDLIQRATVAMVREQHRREACELAAVC